MFRWGFAEAFFSRWAIKRVCKFLLKKKLGNFILGDIDIDQLEVQLTSGTIQLSDLAVNVDYINQKLAGAAVVLKEGSIASLSIKIPWKLQNCQIELEELELVLAPFMENKIQVSSSCSESSSGDKQQMKLGPDKNDLGTVRDIYGSVSLDIHEGVKTIAKIVKWFLTSFHVRLKNLIVAFDPCLEMNENTLPVNKSLVFRIAETEFGTGLSEDVVKTQISKANNCLLGIAKLTNFVKFEGAVIEVLKMPVIDKSSCRPGNLETICNECSSSSLPLGSTTTILTGRGGGISGRMDVSIPWKNGSLDFHKVDAAFCFNPIELSLQPSTIEWIVIIWESFKSAGTAAKSCVQFNTIDSSFSNSRLHGYSSLRNSTVLGADIIKSSNGKFSVELHSDINGETFTEDLLPQTHVIQDWVPLSFKEDKTELEQNYGASIDQFFECFDGLRSFQTNSGTSGLWNWTYSVFSAINVASNLASGSSHMLTEQYVETCLRATVTGVSLFLYFHDKEENVSDQLLGGDRDTNKSCRLDHLSPLTSYTQNPTLNGQSFDSYASCFSSVNVEQSTIAEPNSTGLKMHHLEAKCQDVLINFQIGSRKKNCQISIKHVIIDECYDIKSHGRMFGFSDSSNLCNQMLVNKSLKQKVLDALPPFPVFVQEYDSERSEHNVEKISENSSSQQLVKVGLMESFGDCSFDCVVCLADSDGSSLSSTSFSLHIPPCVLWLHFHLAHSLLNLFKKIETFFKKSSDSRDFGFDDLSGDKKLVPPHDVNSGDSSIKTIPTGDNVQGNFFFAHTRIIICFPLQSMEDFGHLYLMDKFIILEHFPLLVAEEVLQVPSRPLKQLIAPNGSSCAPTFSLHFEVGTFDIYLTNTISKNATIDQSIPFQVKDVSVAKVLSIAYKTDDKHSGISTVWQKGPVTGPWIASRAWSMASTHDRRSRNKVTEKDCDFSSVTAVEDFEEICSDIRQELILSSGFLLYLSFSVIRLNLHSHDYERLNYLFDIVRHGLSNTGSSKSSVSEAERALCNNDVSQKTIIMDCDNLDLCIVFDEVPDCSHSVQKELLGSWNCFRLTVEKFEIMSVSNIGKIRGTDFFRLIHGEGQLFGSIFYGNDCTLAATQDVLLISCMNSASRRGSGDGANVLSFGSARTIISYLCNPQLSRSYTSILFHCGTIIAPGGRLDWISQICSFFNLPCESESSVSDVNQAKSSSNCIYEASFFLDLVDIALIYEPYFKYPAKAGDNVDIGCNQGISEQFVGCLLAASSFSMSSYAISNSSFCEYNIQLQDLGLLICQSSGLNNACGSYDVCYLQKTGYAKVASGSLLVAIVKVHGLRWEVECSDSHINFDTCHDTTHGLFCLIAQLQQLYAPDMEDTLAHLQSRWISNQQTQNTNGSDDSSDNSYSSISLDAGKKLPISDDNSLSIGLLDGIVENAFHTTEGSNIPLNSSVFGQDSYNDNMNPNSMISLINGLSSVKMSYKPACNLDVENSCSENNFGLDNIEIVPEREESLHQLIKSCYFSEIIAPSPTVQGSPPVEDQRRKCDLPAHSDHECGKGRWYKNGYLMIVDNHISNSVLDSDQHHEKSKLMPVDSDSSSHCSQKGKLTLKNIDVRWSMFAGSDWSKQMRNSTGRDGNVSLELNLSGLNIQYAIYPDGEINVSKVSIQVQDFHLYDKSINAPWKMVIGHYNSKDHPRESYAKAFKLDLETVRPDPITPLEDYRLYLEFLPIRLHLDQSQLNFLISFFGNGSSVEESSSISKDIDMSCIADKKIQAFKSQPVVEEALLPFFQKCVVKPLVVRVDYIPRHMDLASLRSGNYVELLNLVSWKGIDLQLKQVCAVGVYGWASVCETVVGQWLEDISHNQVHKLLKGLAPVRSLVSVAAGTSKLVTLPIRSYKRDKKLLKGMQRGAIAFVKSISLEAVGLGVHLASGAHEILLQTEFILRNAPPNAPSPSEKDRIKKSANSNQPVDAQEGILQAYESLSDGLSRTASAILGNPIKEYRRGAGAGSALATAVRAAPAAAIAPVTASAHAMHCALLGMRNSLDPEHKKESMNKYLGSSRPR